MEEKEKIIENKIDLMKPIKLFTNKENWKNSLFIWLVVFLIVGTIDCFLEANKQLSLFRIINFFNIFLIFGYIGVYLHCEINNKGAILPSFNLKKILITALNLYVVLVPAKLLVAILMYFLSPLFSSLMKSPDLLNAIIFTIIVIVFISIAIFAIFAECAYLKDFKLVEGFRYFKIWKLFKTGWVDIIKAYFQAAIIVTPIIGILFLFCFIFKSLFMANKLRFTFFLSPAYHFIFDLIKINLIGQVYKNTLCKIESSLVNNKLINKENSILLMSLFVIIFIFTIMLTNYMHHNIHSNYMYLLYKYLKLYL